MKPIYLQFSFTSLEAYHKQTFTNDNIVGPCFVSSLYVKIPNFSGSTLGKIIVRDLLGNEVYFQEDLQKDSLYYDVATFPIFPGMTVEIFLSVVAGSDGDVDVVFFTHQQPPGPQGEAGPPGGGSPGDSVESETSFGYGADPGIQETYSRGDHTHGTPTDPIPAHVADEDPHPVYALDTELSNHVAAGDPHTVYALDTDLASHVSAPDPHTAYQKESEKGAASGYASLDSSAKIPDSEIPDSITRDSELIDAIMAAARQAPFFFTDFLGTAGAANVEAHQEWDFAVLASGTQAKIAGEPNHPGILRVSSSTTTNSGGYCKAEATAFRIAGGEVFEIIFQHRVAAGANTTLRFGFHDSVTYADAVDGVYFEVPSGSLACSGKTSSNSTRSSTGSSYTLTVNTWYRAKLVVNADATRVDFYLYNEAGSQLWTDYLTANIPTSSGRGTGAGFVATNVGTTAVLLAYFDWMAVWLSGRTLTR
jgi:hypothetical protein